MRRLVLRKKFTQIQLAPGCLLRGQGRGLKYGRRSSKLSIDYSSHKGTAGIHEIDHLLDHLRRHPFSEMID